MTQWTTGADEELRALFRKHAESDKIKRIYKELGNHISPYIHVDKMPWRSISNSMSEWMSKNRKDRVTEGEAKKRYINHAHPSLNRGACTPEEHALITEMADHKATNADIRCALFVRMDICRAEDYIDCIVKHNTPQNHKKRRARQPRNKSVTRAPEAPEAPEEREIQGQSEQRERECIVDEAPLPLLASPHGNKRCHTEGGEADSEARWASKSTTALLADAKLLFYNELEIHKAGVLRMRLPEMTAADVDAFTAAAFGAHTALLDKIIAHATLVTATLAGIKNDASFDELIKATSKLSRGAWFYDDDHYAAVALNSLAISINSIMLKHQVGNPCETDVTCETVNIRKQLIRAANPPATPTRQDGA